MKTIKVFYRYILLTKWLFAGSVLIAILAALIANYSTYLIGELTSAIENDHLDELTNILVIMGIFMVLKVILDSVRPLFTDAYTINVVKNLKLDVMNHLHDLDFAYHTSKSSGSLISAFKRGESAIFDLNFSLNVNLIRLFIDLLFLSVVFVSLDITLLIIVLVPIIINVIWGWRLLNYNLKVKKVLNDKTDDVTGVVVDNMTNFQTVKYFAKEKFETDRLVEKLQYWAEELWRFSYSFRYLNILTSTMSYTGILASTTFAVWQYTEGNFDLSTVVLVSFFVVRFFPNVSNFIYTIRDIVGKVVDLEKYVSLLDEKIEVEESEDAIDLELTDPTIELKNVHFKYNEKDKINVISNVDLKIEAGKSFAFVGESGAGKSTLVKLILRFYDVTKGEILLSGNNIKDLTKESLRKNIGVVPQESIMFNETIEYNLRYGKPEASKKELMNALRIARLDEFVKKLPEGLDTIVGERGIKLSGGQRQRLAIARVFLANPRIIIFDEATSQLDSESEKLIQDAFWEVAKDKTVIIIAHRLSTILKADQIVVFKDGEIIEQGAHKELLDKDDGTYNYLWSIQKGGIIGEDEKLN